MAYKQNHNPFSPIAKTGLWANIHAKRKRIKEGSGEKMRKPGSEGSPTNEALKESQAPAKRTKEQRKQSRAERKEFRQERRAERKNKKEIRKTTKGKDRNFRAVDEGAGMTEKGVKAYRAANSGSELKTAVTGKVKPGSKDAKRRKSFCARSKDWKGERGLAARRRWKC